MSGDAVLRIIVTVERCIERTPLVAEQASQAGCLCRKLLAHLLNQQCPQLPPLLSLSVFARPCHPSRPNSLDLFTQDNI